MNPKGFIREGFQSSTPLFKMYNELIQRGLNESIVNEYFTKLQMSALDVYFNLEQFNYFLKGLANAVGWDKDQRSLINAKLIEYGLEEVL